MRRKQQQGPKETVVRLNTIWNEDALVTLRRLPAKCIDLILCSPPYDEILKYHGFSFDFEAIATEMARALKEGGRIVWVVADQIVDGSLTGTSFEQALYFKNNLGLKFSEDINHQRTGFSFPSRTRHHTVNENVFVFAKGKPTAWNPIIDRPNKFVGFHGGEHSYRGEVGMRTNNWCYPNGGNHTDKFSSGHPAVMQEAMARDLIQTYSNPGDVVYDGFGGSGTTAAEAEKLGRKWIISEISSEYSEIIKRRIEAAKRQSQRSNNRPIDNLKKAA